MYHVGMLNRDELTEDDLLGFRDPGTRIVPQPDSMLPNDPWAWSLRSSHAVGIRRDVLAQLSTLRNLLVENSGMVNWTWPAVIAFLLGWFQFSHGLYTKNHQLIPPDELIGDRDELAMFANLFFGAGPTMRSRMRRKQKPLHWGHYFHQIAERNGVDLGPLATPQSDHGRNDPDPDGCSAG
jgi:hypothetical protein